jgi:hypothetical protein
MTTPTNPNSQNNVKRKLKTFTRTRTGNFVAAVFMFAAAALALSWSTTLQPNFHIKVGTTSIVGFFLIWTGLWHLCVGLFYDKLGAFNNQLIDKYLERD